jgi:hypothetical protein
MRILVHICYAPCESEFGEDIQDLSTEVSLGLRVIVGHVERVAEHVLYLVTVHDAHPLAPQVAAGSL